MARVAHAVRALLDQVHGEVVGDPDGFGVFRSAMVTTTAPLEVIAADRRVADLAVVDTPLGRVALVTVRADRLGDVADVFDLG